MFYTEKITGNIMVSQGGGTPTLFANVSVNSDGERGLLSLVFDPDFNSNHFVYAFHTKTGGTDAEVVRFTDSNSVGGNMTVIVPSLPAANNHNGGRLAFGNDGKLYVTVGENGDPSNSQNDNVPTGKVLRYNPDGTIPADNPIPGNPMFTKGHRNDFGICVDPASGTIFVSENGPDCDDEINRLQAGGNYGWRPGYPCNDSNPAYIQPIQRFSSVIAPTGIAIGTGPFAGSLLLTSFDDDSLREVSLQNYASGGVTGMQTLFTYSQHLIDVTIGPDGNLYLATGDDNGAGSIIRLTQ